MNFLQYRMHISKNYDVRFTSEVINGLTCDIAFDEEMKWDFGGVKMKVFSIMTYKENVDKKTIEGFSKACYEYSKETYLGFRKGLQVTLVSYALIVTESVSQDAIKYVQKNVKKHYSAFEIPMIYDLSTNTLYAIDKRPMWGAIVFGYLKKYMMNHFIIPK